MNSNTIIADSIVQPDGDSAKTHNRSHHGLGFYFLLPQSPPTELHGALIQPRVTDIGHYIKSRWNINKYSVDRRNCNGFLNVLMKLRVPQKVVNAMIMTLRTSAHEVKRIITLAFKRFRSWINSTTV